MKILNYRVFKINTTWFLAYNESSHITGFLITLIQDKNHTYAQTNKGHIARNLEAAEFGVSTVAQRVKSPTSIHEDAGLIPGLTQ